MFLTERKTKTNTYNDTKSYHTHHCLANYSSYHENDMKW